MSLEDLRRLKAEANGEVYLTQTQQKLLEAADKAEYDQEAEQQQLQQQIQQQRQGGLLGSTPQGIDFFFLDRMLTIKLPPESKRKGLWLTYSDVLEQFGLINLDSATQASLMREYLELIYISSGEGNEIILQEKIGAFLIRVISMKSRSDFKEYSVRERTAWMTHKTEQQSVVKLPEESSKGAGFLSILRRKWEWNARIVTLITISRLSFVDQTVVIENFPVNLVIVDIG